MTASLALIFVENEMVLENVTQLLDLCQCATELQKLHLSQPETIYSEKEVLDLYIYQSCICNEL